MSMGLKMHLAECRDIDSCWLVFHGKVSTRFVCIDLTDSMDPRRVLRNGKRENINIAYRI